MHTRRSQNRCRHESMLCRPDINNICTASEGSTVITIIIIIDASVKSSSGKFFFLIPLSVSFFIFRCRACRSRTLKLYSENASRTLRTVPAEFLCPCRKLPRTLHDSLVQSSPSQACDRPGGYANPTSRSVLFAVERRWYQPTHVAQSILLGESFSTLCVGRAVHVKVGLHTDYNSCQLALNSHTLRLLE